MQSKTQNALLISNLPTTIIKIDPYLKIRGDISF